MDNQTAHDMAEYIQLTDEIIATEKQASQVLRKENEALQARSQKQASSPFEAAQVSTTVGNIIEAGFLKEAERDLAITEIQRDPAALLRFLDKLASTTIKTRSVASLGQGVEKQATASGSTERESDKVFDRTFAALGTRI